MERYYKRKSTLDSSSFISHEEPLKRSHIEVDLSDLPADPGLRCRITDYDPNIQDQVRRAYLLKEPCQPRNHNFPQRKFGKSLRRFNPSWFNEFGYWLEYSISKDAAFCLCCYLFKPDVGEEGGGDSFIGNGYTNWKKKERLQMHEGCVNSVHNQAWGKCQSLLNQEQHIQTIFTKLSDEAKNDYKVRLNASIDCIRFLLRQGLPFRGHGEFEQSSNQGNFLKLLKCLSNQNEAVRDVILKNAHENLKLIAPTIQKDIVRAAAFEITSTIIKELGDGLFFILLDESRDVSMKEQMAVVLRYLNKNGCVVERFLGIKHVTSTSSLSLKEALENLFATHGLSISMLRGQGYDGASNMRGEFNGLKTLIIKENECAYYVHCFTHQLQLALVAVAKNHVHIATLFTTVTNIVNVVGGSCKRRDILRDKQVTKIIEALKDDKIASGQGLNQETTLIRASDTRWGSHYGTLRSLIGMFSPVIDVLDMIVDDGSNSEQRAEASHLLDSMQSFEFVFSLHLMKSILGITNDLSQALQRKDQDIENAMKLVEVSKKRLQMMRDNGWDSLMDEVFNFSGKHRIDVPNMDDSLWEA